MTWTHEPCTDNTHPKMPGPTEPSPLIFDSSLSDCVPAIPDAYNGAHRLRFSRDTLPIDSDIPYFRRKGKESYNDIRYEGDYRPEDSPTKVDIMPDDPVNDKASSPAVAASSAPNPAVNADANSPPVTESSTLHPAVDEGTGVPELAEHRTSQRERKELERFTNNMQTVWKPGRTITT